MPVTYAAGRIIGSGTNISNVLGMNAARKSAVVTNLGPAPAWLGDKDLGDPSFGKGIRIRPGESLTFTSPSPLYSITWAANAYVLEVLDE